MKNIRLEYRKHGASKIDYHARRRGRRGQGVGDGKGINISAASGACGTVKF